MKIAPLLCAICSCALALEAGAARIQESPQAASGKGGGSKGDAAVTVSPHGGTATPQRAVGPLPRSNADRLHALLSARPRARITNPSPRVASSHAALGTAVASKGVEGLRAAGPTRATMERFAMSARTTSSLNATAKGSMVGGPHAPDSARLGGPSSARTQNRAVIDGANLHRKPY